MEEPWAEWEAAAGEIIDATCTSTPVDAFNLAAACGFDVVPWSGPGAEIDIEGRRIKLNTRMRPVRQHGRIAHELGHFALVRNDVENTEEGARWVGGALMLPQREFVRDLVDTAWSLPALRAKHIHVSAEAIAIRIVQLRDAVATVIDNGRLTRRVWSPWLLGDRLKRVSKFERELANAALASGAEERHDELCYAVPVVDGRYERVIVVCEMEQLALRL